VRNPVEQFADGDPDASSSQLTPEALLEHFMGLAFRREIHKPAK
jgi:hypothetical protein